MTAERQTEHLTLRPWSDAYLDDFATVCADPEAMRFITRGRPIPPERIRDISRRSVRLWEDHGFGPWAALETATGRWVGRIGLNLLADWPGPHRWEVGFELAPEFWGRGLATEGAREAVSLGLEDVGLERIISATVPDHRASRRVLEKCGLVFQGEVAFRGVHVVWYAIDRTGFAKPS